MNSKAKGARAERRARAMLEAAGWAVVRAGGSLGQFDLVAFSRAGLRLIQVKVNHKPRSAEREALSRSDYHNFGYRLQAMSPRESTEGEV